MQRNSHHLKRSPINNLVYFPPVFFQCIFNNRIKITLSMQSCLWSIIVQAKHLLFCFVFLNPAQTNDTICSWKAKTEFVFLTVVILGPSTVPGNSDVIEQKSQ